MRYYANPCNIRVLESMLHGDLGMIATPLQPNRVRPGLDWCGDSGAFSARYVGDEAYLEWISALSIFKDQCAFITAPDVVCDPVETLKRSLPMMPRIRELGFPVAYIGQDGLLVEDIPWDEFDVFFIGGSTEWKLSTDVHYLTTEAICHGKTVHMGRVNTLRRMRWAKAIGCASVDGTFLKFSPDKNLEMLVRWSKMLNEQEVYW